jgi:hypothetical protein
MEETDDIGAAIRAAAATVEAPQGLRERVEADRATVHRRRRWRFGLLAGASGVAAALVVALLLVLPGSGPTLDDAALAALARPNAPAPAAVAGAGVLTARVDDVAFPDWRASQGWRAVGQRTGKIAGRSARTVTYEDAAGRRLGYTIVSGDALDVPAGEVTRFGTTPITVVRRNGATVATWVEHGHTCVLAARDTAAQALVELASAAIY